MDFRFDSFDIRGNDKAKKFNFNIDDNPEHIINGKSGNK